MTSRLAAVLIVAALWTTVSVARAQETTPEAAVQRVFERRGYQRDLPDTPRPDTVAAPTGGQPGGGARGERPTGTPPGAPGGGTVRGIAAGSSFCFWSLAGLVLVAGLAWLFNARRNAGLDVALPAGRPAEGGDESVVAAAPPTDALRRQAEDAAHAGDFVAATHLLLLGGLAHVTGAPPEDACTSRERLAETPEGSARRIALGVLVQTVEAGLFGGRPVDRTAFERCVASYDDLLREPLP